jgi:hypothetical protein
MTYEITIEAVHIVNAFIIIFGGFIAFLFGVLWDDMKILSTVMIITLIVAFGTILLDVNGIIQINVRMI